MNWILITGEYPPQRGGVSDYTRNLAAALAAAGDGVHVLAPGWPEAEPGAAGVTLHRVSGAFGPRSFAALRRLVEAVPRPRRLLLQYVPHAYGWKAMNVPFCAWLRRQRASEEIWVMFHEVAFPLEAGQPVALRVLAHATRLMARLVCQASTRRLVSIPAWNEMLRDIAHCEGEYLPVPSNIPDGFDPALAARIRNRLLPAGEGVVAGHFGTYNANAAMLAGMLPELARRQPGLRFYIVGAAGPRLVRELAEAHPWLADRVIASGEVPAEEVAAHLGACDILLQPYIDGVSSRRSSLLAGLALGLPIVSTTGRLSESFWERDRAVALAPADSPAAFAAHAEDLLAAPERRYELGRRAAAIYRERFHVGHVVRRLRESSPAACEPAREYCA